MIEQADYHSKDDLGIISEGADGNDKAIRHHLKEIIRMSDVEAGPTHTEYHGEWINVTIAIDDDHVAHIRMPMEDYKLLMQ